MHGPKPNPTRLAFLRQIWPYLRPYRLRVALALGSLMLAAGLVLTLGQGLRYVIDQGFATASATALNWSLAGMLAITAGLALATYGRFYNVTWLGERVCATLRQRLYDHLLQLDVSFYETNRVGDLAARITTDVTVIEGVLSTSLSMALRNFLLLCGGLVLLALTSAKLLLIVVIGVPLIVAPIIYFARRVRSLARTSQDKLAMVAADTAETLGAIRTIKAFAEETSHSQSFATTNNAAFAAARARFAMRAKLVATVIFLVFAAIGTILWVGGHDVLAGRISAGQLSAFIFYAVIVASSTAAITEVLAELDRAAGASSRIFELLQLQPSVMPPASPAALPTPARGEINLHGIGYAYASAPEKAVLHNFTLHIAAGEKLALVGPSGAGKSTLFNLLLRFYDPTAGHITFDGIDLKALDPNTLRRQMALVPQDPVLMSGTIAENIRFGMPASDAAVKAAAAAAQATEFIEKLPEQWHTPVGERGVRLSGGQRQRLALARALLRNPPVLLLDEATSALDAESEHLVQAALNTAMQGRTTIIIAHRLATIRAADRIVVLDQGQIVATGRHDDLVAAGGLYARLASLQFVDN